MSAPLLGDSGGQLLDRRPFGEREEEGLSLNWTHTSVCLIPDRSDRVLSDAVGTTVSKHRPADLAIINNIKCQAVSSTLGYFSAKFLFIFIFYWLIWFIALEIRSVAFAFNAEQPLLLCLTTRYFSSKKNKIGWFIALGICTVLPLLWTLNREQDWLIYRSGNPYGVVFALNAEQRTRLLIYCSGNLYGVAFALNALKRKRLVDLLLWESVQCCLCFERWTATVIAHGTVEPLFKTTLKI